MQCHINSVMALNLYTVSHYSAMACISTA